MTLKKRFVIIFAFGFRLLCVSLPAITSSILTKIRLIPIIATRLFYLSPAKNPDPTFSSIIPNIITEVALQFSIISASVTSLRPFLRSLHPGYTVDSSGTHNRSGLRSGIRTGSQDPYYRLDAISKKGRSEVSGSVTANDRSTDGLAPGHGIAYPGKLHTRADKGDIELGRSSSKTKLSSAMASTADSDSIDGMPDPMVIRKTTDWVIRYENEQK